MIATRSRRIALAASLAALLTACGGKTHIGGDPGLRVVQGPLPTPARADAMSTALPYYIGPFDRIIVDVFGIEELSQREFQVDAAGRLSFPLVGIVDAMGKTPGELESELRRDLLLAHVRDPQVTVNLKEAVSRVVTVEGQVAKPGVYPVVGKLTLMGAVATAGSTTEFAKLNDVIIFRTVEGQRYAALYNLNSIRHGVYPDPDVYASDVVMVGDSPGRRLFRDILQITPALITPAVYALDNLRQ